MDATTETTIGERLAVVATEEVRMQEVVVAEGVVKEVAAADKVEAVVAEVVEAVVVEMGSTEAWTTVLVEDMMVEACSIRSQLYDWEKGHSTREVSWRQGRGYHRTGKSYGMAFRCEAHR